ncbi:MULTISPECIES: GDSL-type esterase/lipase family protein [unclassified Tolypothrix]|uniref:GDSL-type esterase/lipase family protein n=1 Tax=unclassified Tolypothrix TaxID=2649714 RepID=UPI0005EAB3AA|nr:MULTISPECIES: GDSL-type esterase/lipase family protein [unclassified Tolypothrix]BAY93893.1 lipolytic enzyme, G-D-S-L [Microchaete diplosiphon NIES-3275]EKF03611.1 GDSL-like lipase/acylhydrolase [Tolypothrix sp. PCC 7601]MBE9084101.1 lipase [Tolypothrix sp. LEGE 11397]UYD27674.1 lipase [Tolypothrix sp. PCC 7712]UYD36465.1 lipase [Tolypothrix sp. PCC 7601]
MSKFQSEPREIRICFVGESFINGTGDPDFLGWTGRVCAGAHQRGYEITYYNLGVRTETTRFLKQRWRQEVSYRLASEYDGRVVFSFGVNDSGWAGKQQGIDLTESLENTRAILTEAKQLYPVLMVGPPPCGDENQEQRNQQIAHQSQQFALVCRELDIPYLDVFSTLVNSSIWLAEAKANDGAHPRAAGYAEFAAIVQNWDAWLSWFTL